MMGDNPVDHGDCRKDDCCTDYWVKNWEGRRIKVKFLKLGTGSDFSIIRSWNLTSFGEIMGWKSGVYCSFSINVVLVPA